MGGWEAGAVRWDKVGVCLDDVSIWRSIRWNQVSWVRDAIEQVCGVGLCDMVYARRLFRGLDTMCVAGNVSLTIKCPVRTETMGREFRQKNLPKS